MIKAAFVQGVAQGAGFVTGITMTVSALALVLAFVIPLIVKWIGRAL